MTPLHIETPLIESRPLSACSERRVWLKMEAFQPSGSFKLRGIGRACQEYARRRAARFLSSSGGNAGIAVAHAGRQLGVPVTVVVPETTSDHAQALLRQEAAEVIVHGPSWQEANAHAQSLISENDAFLHPFDDQLLWEGHASMIDEVARTGWRPDVIAFSVRRRRAFVRRSRRFATQWLGGHACDCRRDAWDRQPCAVSSGGAPCGTAGNYQHRHFARRSPSLRARL
jgi:L-serine/L-threonine ammonia-lyase